MKIDIDTVQQVITGWKQIRQRLDDLRLQSRALVEISNPGGDGASRIFAGQANSAGGSYHQANSSLSAVVQAHIDKLNAAIQQYQATEHGNAANLQRQDR